jgi:hypothetical protein
MFGVERTCVFHMEYVLVESCIYWRDLWNTATKSHIRGAAIFLARPVFLRKNPTSLLQVGTCTILTEYSVYDSYFRRCQQTKHQSLKASDRNDAIPTGETIFGSYASADIPNTASCSVGPLE